MLESIFCTSVMAWVNFVMTAIVQICSLFYLFGAVIAVLVTEPLILIYRQRCIAFKAGGGNTV